MATLKEARLAKKEALELYPTASVGITKYRDMGHILKVNYSGEIIKKHAIAGVVVIYEMTGPIKKRK